MSACFEHTSSAMLNGVIEGFYGPPWTDAERIQVLDWMQSLGLNTYFYAPKDDLKQRLLWREPYTPSELAMLADLRQACLSRGVDFVFALSPGLDMSYASSVDLDQLKEKYNQLRSLGVVDFALLLDDIPDGLSANDQASFADFASAHSHLANSLYRWIRSEHARSRFLFCPTPYCDRMHRSHLGGKGYLEILGRQLDPNIDVFWTGPEIISSEITLEELAAITRLLRRKPLIWDNLHANDYDGRRFFCGPYSGRPLDLRQGIRGILHNPNNEALLNLVPWTTLADYLQTQGESWDPRASYLKAMRQWYAQFESSGNPISWEAFLLFGDCFYLPQQHGDQAQCLLDEASKVFTHPFGSNGHDPGLFRALATRLRDACREVVHLKQRPLFNALYRRNWELREEMDLLLHCLGLLEQNPLSPLCSDYHLPGTYRGGLVLDVQRLLTQGERGGFEMPTNPSAHRGNRPASLKATDGRSKE
jgi:protein O-GlcNAcase/histone acetyltransferase